MHTGTKQQLTHQSFTIFFTITTHLPPQPTTIVSTQNYKKTNPSMPHLPLDFSKLHQSLTTQGSPAFLIKLPTILVVVVVGGVVEQRCEFGPLPLKKRLCFFVLLRRVLCSSVGDGQLKLPLNRPPEGIMEVLRFHSCCSETIKRMGSCALF
jgi:hypothetical protein